MPIITAENKDEVRNENGQRWKDARTEKGAGRGTVTRRGAKAYAGFETGFGSRRLKLEHQTVHVVLHRAATFLLLQQLVYKRKAAVACSGRAAYMRRTLKRTLKAQHASRNKSRLRADQKRASQSHALLSPHVRPLPEKFSTIDRSFHALPILVLFLDSKANRELPCS